MTVRSEKMRTKAIMGLAALAALYAPTANAQEEKNHISLSAGVDALSGFYPSGFGFEESPTLLLDAGVVRNTASLSTIYAVSRDNYLILTGVQADVSVPLGYELSAGVGLAGFLLPNAPVEPSTNVHARIGYDGPLHAGVDTIYDFGSGDGMYASLTAGRSQRIMDGLTLRAETQLGYNHHYFTAQNGLSHAESSLRAVIELGRMMLEPHVAYSAALRDDFKNRFSAGVRLSMSGILEGGR